MSEKKFLDGVGLGHTWSKIKSLLNGKADTDLNNVTNDNFRDKAIDAGVGGIPIVTATSTDGVTYTATVNGVTELTTGLTITIIPDVVSTNISAKLNVNGLGDKYIRQSTTNNNATALTPKNANWMAANKPVTIQFDGTQWKTIAARSNVSDMNGVLAIANGGTGASDAETARANLGINDLLLNYCYPVGTLYWSKNNTDPSTLFGGTWTRVKDKFILAAGDTYAQGSTGGEATVTLTTAQMPAHSHTRGTMDITGNLPNTRYYTDNFKPNGAFAVASTTYAQQWENGSTDTSTFNHINFTASRSWTGSTSSVGSGSAHNNMPPYVTYYCWERTE